MIQAVIFDLDDTLISEKEYIKSGFKVVCKFIADNHQLKYSDLYNSILHLYEKIQIWYLTGY